MWIIFIRATEVKIEVIYYSLKKLVTRLQISRKSTWYRHGYYFCLKVSWKVGVFKYYNNNTKLVLHGTQIFYVYFTVCKTETTYATTFRRWFAKSSRNRKKHILYLKCDHWPQMKTKRAFGWRPCGCIPRLVII